MDADAEGHKDERDVPGGLDTNRIRKSLEHEKLSVINAAQLIDGINFLKFEFIPLYVAEKNGRTKEKNFRQMAENGKFFIQATHTPSHKLC